MRAEQTDDTALFIAAQAGDRAALDELVARHLPLVYTIVRRALGGYSDVDDVVQDIMLRALRQLALVRVPDSYRAWLMTIAVRQVSTYLHGQQLAAGRTAELAEAADVPDAAFEDAAVLRVQLSDQRRQVVRASRWLDPDDRALLPLWWMETAGRLTRSELATALGVRIAHAAVRVQRMRVQLGVSRAVVAALEAAPGCAVLETLMAGWDGAPSPLWRKRVARHVRSCARCAEAAEGMIPAERLLVEFVLLPVPATLTAAVLGKMVLTGAGAASSPAAMGGGAGVGGELAGKVGLLGQLGHAVAAHPVVATVVAGALAAGPAVTAATWPAPEPRAPAVVAAATAPPAPGAPSPTGASLLAPGTASLESINAGGRFVATTGFLGVLAPVTAGSGAADRGRATFEVVRGLADAGCFSFRTREGWYLRHSSWRVRLSLNQGSRLFRGDATFCPRAGAAAGAVSLESSNYPGWFLRHRGDELWVDQSDGSAAFRADSSFLVRPPLAR